MRAVVTCVLIGGVLSGQTAASADEARRPRHTDEIVWIDPATDLAPDARASGISKILFINRCPTGCTLTPGDNDSRYDTSSIIGGVTRTLTAFDLGDDVFDQVVACVRDVYAPYDVEVVTSDPGAGSFHHEAILAGTPEEIGRDSRVGGIAPATCEPLNNVISFSFANKIGPDIEELCWTVSQESAHSFGLPNHVYDCLDPMTYIEGPCGRKYFRNDEIECAGLDSNGNFVVQPCVCQSSGTRQNSHERLFETFGASPTPMPPPTVTIVYPEANASVDDNFSIFFQAVDPRLIETADVYINGWRFETREGWSYDKRDDPYSLEAPDYPDGYIDIEVHAFSNIGVEGTSRVTVLKGSPCGSDDDCFEHMGCSDGRCSYPPPVGDLGDSCDYDQYCKSGICAGVCTQACPAGVSDSCPDGFECSADGVCVEPGGGCCTVAGGRRASRPIPLAEVALFALGFLVLVRRRSPRSRR